jgi:pimeloyl-ACP methyl ester carboxylesterase
MPRIEVAPGVSLELTDRGDPRGPAVLLLPGPTDSWRSYEPVLDRLPPDLRAVAVSQRGHGASDKPAAGYGVRDFAADAVALLDALGIERAVVVGHSASCLVARRVALDRPDRVAGLLLEASPLTLRGDPVLLDFVETVVATLDDPIDAAFARGFVASTSSESVPPGLVDVLAGEVLAVPARVWRETFSGLLRYDDLDELPRIRAPALLVWGDRDGLVSRDAQDRLVAAMRTAEVTVHAGAGHTPRWEAPERFGSELAAFARRVGGR